MELNKFLVKAKISTYASAENVKKVILSDGAKELVYKLSKFKYRDRYYGFNPFIGREIVFAEEKIIWSMNYYGRVIVNTIPPKRVYEFLKIVFKTG